MKEPAGIMIKNFKIMKLGYDFMGYKVDRKNSLSFHHLIIPRRHCEDYNLGDGYYEWNGAILVRNTSHDYLHLIEAKDHDIFLKITSEMIDQNIKGRLDIENLRRINELLKHFEKEHSADVNSKGKILIKEEYKKGRIKLWKW